MDCDISSNFIEITLCICWGKLIINPKKKRKVDGFVTSFLKLILDHHGGDHEDVANAATDSHRRQQEEPRHPGPRGGQCDWGNIKVAVHAPRLIHP